MNFDGCTKLQIEPEHLFAAVEIKVKQEVTVGGAKVEVPEIELDGYKWSDKNLFAIKDLGYYKTTQAYDYYSVAKVISKNDDKKMETIHEGINLKKDTGDETNIEETSFNDWKLGDKKSYVSTCLLD